MKSRKLFLLLLAISTISLSLDGEVKTGATLELVNESNENEKFEFSKASYDIKLLDLKLSDKNTGFEFGTVLKSSRKNLLIDDYSAEEYSKTKKSHNHDIQSKLFLNWNYNNNKIKSDLAVEYYVENFAKRKITVDGKIQEEPTFNYEFIDGDKKYEGGEVLLHSKLQFNPLEDLKIYSNIDYRAFNLIDYTKAKPYLDIETKLNYDDKVNIFDFSHDFKLNLRSFAVAYDSEKEDTDQGEDLDIFNGNFVKRYKQNFDLKYTRNHSDNHKYSIISKLKNNGYYVGGETKEDPINFIDQVVYFDLLSKLDNTYNLLDSTKLNINQTLGFETKFEVASLYDEYMKKWDKDVWSLIKPQYELKLDFTQKINEQLKLEPSIRSKYIVTVPLKNKIFSFRYLANTLEIEPNIMLNYSKENLNIKAELLNPMTLTLLKDNLKNVVYNPSQKVNVEYTALKELKISSNIKNQINFNTVSDTQGRQYADSLNLNYGMDLKLEYNPLENISFINELKLDNKMKYTYILDGGNVAYFPVTDYVESGEKKDDVEVVIASPNSITDEEIPKMDKYLKPVIDINRVVDAKTRGFKNEAKRLLDIQKYSYIQTLEYRYTKDKLELKPALVNTFELDLIALTKEMQHKLKTDDSGKADKKELVTSDNYKTNYNIGGKIEIKPQLNVTYNVTVDMTVNALVEIPIILEKKVINEITEAKRVDKGTYGLADKNLKLKVLPKFSLNFAYKW